MVSSPTWFVEFRPSVARAVLLIWALSLVGCMYVSLSPRKIETLKEPAPAGRGDIIFYWAIVQRVAAGEEYYRAHTEVQYEHGYPTSSVFNWRAPLPIVLLARLPQPEIAKALLVACAVAAVIMGYTAMRSRWSLWESTAGALLLCGALLHLVSENQYVLPILWAECFLALSICAYGLNFGLLGVLCGLAAAFCRDLAVLYCLLMLAWAVWHKKASEVRAWGIGVLGLMVYYGLHMYRVASLATHQPLGDISQWFEQGGLAFVVATAQVNAPLLKLPQWVAAIYLPCAVLGLIGWRDSWGGRVSVATVGYLSVFFIVGKSVNQYWGLLAAPFLCLGAARAPAALRDLWARSRI